jgi:hypothetical protein
MRAWHKVHTVYIACKNIIMTAWHKVHTVYIASKNVIARHLQLAVTPSIGDVTGQCHSSVVFTDFLHRHNQQITLSAWL